MFRVYSIRSQMKFPLLSQVRTVVITRNKKDNKLLQIRERSKKKRQSFKRQPSNASNQHGARPKESVASLWLRKEKERQVQRERSELGQNLKQLQEFTKQLKLSTEKENEEKKRKQMVKELAVLEDPNRLLSEDIDVLLKTVLEEEAPNALENADLMQIGSSSSTPSSSLSSTRNHLFEYVDNEALMKLTPILIDKIGDSIKYIRNRNTLDWELMIRDMYNKNGMMDMTTSDVTKILLNIPKKEKHKSISFINEMMFDAKIPKNLLIYNLFLTAYSSDEKYEILCESLFQEMKMADIKPDLYTFSALVKSHGVSNNIPKINEALELMKNEYGLEPNKQIYTSVLQTCVKLGDHKQASEVFDMMKFLSQSTQPDAKSYESIILSNIENDDIERALDLYDELRSRPGDPIKPSRDTILLLARGCASRKELFHKGWEFIFEYHDMKYEPNSKMLETMMHLAAKDGDVSFTRALFNTMMESRANDTNFNPGKVAISLLMLSYAKFNINHKPISVLNERVRLLRARTIDVTNFNFLPPRSPPFLPINEIVGDNSIIAESKAIWAYTVLNFHDFVTEKTVGSYLYAATTRGDNITEFKRRFETVTYLDESGIPPKEEKIEEGKKKNIKDVEIIEEADIDVDPLLQVLKSVKLAPPAIQLSVSSNFKIARTSEFYNLAILAAKNFKDLDFATRIWTERGKYRKTDNFKKLSAIKKMKYDFEFAQYMLSFFTDMKLLDDLTLIVMSTQNQFNWEWSHVKSAYQLAETSGNEEIKTLLSAAVNNKNFKMRPLYRNYTHPVEN